jgi:hypothetical protein
MGMIRLLLIVLMTLTASVSGALDAGHATAMEHAHATVQHVDEDQPACCSDSTQHTQNCHVLPAVLPISDLNVSEPESCGDVSFGFGILLTGIKPSGPLDPPRTV